jgi:hypothetical protein
MQVYTALPTKRFRLRYIAVIEGFLLHQEAAMTMLISPTMYIENLVHQPYAKLIETRRKLIAELEQLENSFANSAPTSGSPSIDDLMLDSNNDARYKVFLEYLDELTNLMIKRAPELTGVPYATEGWDDGEEVI